MFIGKYNKSVVLTYMGVAISIIGAYFAVQKNFNYAIVCLVFAGIADLFDGVVARRCFRTEEEKKFGIQIDTLADMINFVMLPLFIFMNLEGSGVYKIIISLIYCLAAIIRLAFFNVLTETSDIKHYRGLPVTYSALIIPLVWTVLVYSKVGFHTLVFSLLLILLALLYVLDIPIAKPRGLAYIFFSALAIITSALLIMAGV